MLTNKTVREREREREGKVSASERERKGEGESFWFRPGTEGSSVRLCPLLVRKGNIKGKTGVMRE